MKPCLAVLGPVHSKKDVLPTIPIQGMQGSSRDKYDKEQCLKDIGTCVVY